jgi:RNA polymerase sigma-70 factor, ECF subfamily
MRVCRKEMMQVSAVVRGVTFVGPRQTKLYNRHRYGGDFDSQKLAPNIPKKPPTSARRVESQTLTETEIIRRAQDGENTMFEYLYRLYSRRVYATCLRLMKNPTEAEDLTQEAFLLLFRKIHTFRGESAFFTWLHRLAVNRVLMHLRKKALQLVSIETARDPDDESGSFSTDIGGPDLSMEGTLDRVDLERCIALLPAGCRTVFVLHDVQGHEHREIAEILGHSVGASKSQLHKARIRLRQLLNEIQRGKARHAQIAAA